MKKTYTKSVLEEFHNRWSKEKKITDDLADTFDWNNICRFEMPDKLSNLILYRAERGYGALPVDVYLDHPEFILKDYLGIERYYLIYAIKSSMKKHIVGFQNIKNKDFSILKSNELLYTLPRFYGCVMMTVFLRHISNNQEHVQASKYMYQDLFRDTLYIHYIYDLYLESLYQFLSPSEKGAIRFRGEKELNEISESKLKQYVYNFHSKKQLTPEIVAIKTFYSLRKVYTLV